jgi:hypothetical protein
MRKLAGEAGNGFLGILKKSLWAFMEQKPRPLKGDCVVPSVF